jgi:hypothetical protein
VFLISVILPFTAFAPDKIEKPVVAKLFVEGVLNIIDWYPEVVNPAPVPNCTKDPDPPLHATATKYTVT